MKTYGIEKLGIVDPKAVYRNLTQQFTIILIKDENIFSAGSAYRCVRHQS